MEEMNEDGKRLIENLEKVDSAVLTFKDAYDILIKIYKRYIEMDEKYYPIIACWILGNYLYRQFPSFPYIFLNAPKQSGKSRFLKLSAFLVNGIYTVNLTEAVLFRETTPIFIDELENITKKEKSGLRELLNVAYKKGGVVKRARKIESSGKTVIETFELYRPVAIANIEGMDDILEDRCIVINLERSFNKEITRRLELFEMDEDIKKFKEAVKSVVCVNVVVEEIVYREILKGLFNYFNLSQEQKDTNDIITNSKETTQTTPVLRMIINKIEETALQGRDLELFLPLIIIASQISEEVVDQVINFAVEYSTKRKETNIVESRDTILIGFLAAYMKANNLTSSDFIPLSQMVRKFQQMNPDDDWFTTKWLGWALKRLGKVVIEKRRLGRGREVRLNLDILLEKASKYGFNVDELAEEMRLAESQSTFREWEVRE